MTTKELQIGDWVTDDNGMPMFVQAIYGDDTVYLDFDGNEADTWETDIKDVKPIPITKEILEKNGFKIGINSTFELGDGKWLDYYHHEYRLRMWWKGIDEWENHSRVKDIIFQCHAVYLHELQHALRLCGIDKEIKL